MITTSVGAIFVSGESQGVGGGLVESGVKTITESYGVNRVTKDWERVGGE